MNPASVETEPPVLKRQSQDDMRSLVHEIEHDLEARIDRADMPKNLHDAVRYAVLGGGKRLRPMLVVMSCEAVGGRLENAHAAASAIELVHTFSLVHDDLPAMDDDDLRRGRPSLHIHAGEAMAILAGDAMLAMAFEIVSLISDQQQSAALTAELSAATRTMIVGQVYDTLGGFPSAMSDDERLDFVHRQKTAALITAACRMGGVCGRVSENHLSALTKFGQAVGLMFQIVDDLLDVTQSAEHIGKATGKDAEAGKLTYPGIHGIEESQTEIERLRKNAHKALEPFGLRAARLHNLCDSMATRTR